MLSVRLIRRSLNILGGILTLAWLALVVSGFEYALLWPSIVLAHLLVIWFKPRRV